MNRMKEVKNKDVDSKLLATVQDKCIELEAIVADKRYKLFKGASVVVAVPTLDECSRDIIIEDFQLYKQHCKDALDMTFYLIENNANFIDIINFINTEVNDCLNRLDGRQLDYLICLNEFIDIEKNAIVQSLCEKIGSDFKVIDLL